MSRIDFRDAACRAVAHLIPRRVAYWVFLRVAVHATQGKYSDQIVPELTTIEALARWGADLT